MHRQVYNLKQAVIKLLLNLSKNRMNKSTRRRNLTSLREGAKTDLFHLTTHVHITSGVKTQHTFNFKSGEAE